MKIAQATGAPAAPAADNTKKLWGGRFTGKTDPLMEKFNESLPFDKRMWAEDIQVGLPRGRGGHCSARGRGQEGATGRGVAWARTTSYGQSGALARMSPTHPGLGQFCCMQGVTHPTPPRHVPPSCAPQGSQAYAKALAKAGILTDAEAATIVEGLGKVGRVY